MQLRRYVVTVASTDDVDADEHVSADEIAGFLSDYIGNNYANLVECYRISDLQIVDNEDGSFTAVPEHACTEKCTTVQESTPVGVPEPEVPATEELTTEQQAILDAPQHAELPPETASYGEENGDWPPLDVSKLNPPAAARWVAVDKNGRAYYYPVKPLCGKDSWHSPGYPVVGKAPGRYDTSNWQEALWQVNPDSQQQVEQPRCVDAADGDKPKAQISGALVPAFAAYASKLVAELPAIKTAQQYQGIIDADKYTDMFAPAIAKKLMQLADRPDWSHYCVVCSTGDAYWLSSLHKDSAEFKLMHIGSGFCTFDWSSSLVTDLPEFKYDIESCESRINYVAINASGSLMGFIDRPCFQPTGVWSAPSRLCEIPDFGMFDARYCDSSLRRVVRDGRPRALRVRNAAKLDVTKLKPPAEARWVAVDESGRAWYYTSKPHVEENGWTCGDDGELLTMEPGVFDTSNWQEEVHPVNLEQGS